MRAQLYKLWRDGCPEIHHDIEENHYYVESNSLNWEYESEVALKCVPGFQLPTNTDQTNLDFGTNTQTLKCLVSGDWDFDPVKCVPLECPEPMPIPFKGARTLLTANTSPEGRLTSTLTTLRYECPDYESPYNAPLLLEGFMFSTIGTKERIREINTTCEFDG